MAAPWRDRPARADRARRSASARSRNGEAREHPATSTQHEIATFKRSAKRHSSSRPAVPPSSDGVESISTRSSASRYVQSDAPTANRTPMQDVLRYGAQPAAGTPRSQVDPAVDRSVPAASMGVGGAVGVPFSARGTPSRRARRCPKANEATALAVCCGAAVAAKFFGVGWLRVPNCEFRFGKSPNRMGILFCRT